MRGRFSEGVGGKLGGNRRLGPGVVYLEKLTEQ